MLLSIIIPTFNSANTLRKCIESILYQSFPDFEILIMDGLSIDNTTEIAHSFKDSRISVFSDKDDGIYDAMNKGIEKSSGQWLYFIGSDDELYDSNVLTKIHTEILSSDCDFIYGNVWFNHAKIKYAGQIDRKKLMTENNICHQAVFYKKNLFDRLGRYNTDFKVWADWDFNVRCFSYPNIKIKYVDTLIARYEELNGISGNNKDELFYALLPLEYKNRELLSRAYNSREYRIGKFLLRIPRLLDNLIKRKK